MKLLVTVPILAFILLVGCDSDKANKPAGFNPPSWIYGEWSDKNRSMIFTFSSSNVIMRSSLLGFSVNYKEALKLGGSVAEDYKSSREYKFTITTSEVSQTFRFEKFQTRTELGSLHYTLTTTGITQGPFTLSKSSFALSKSNVSLARQETRFTAQNKEASQIIINQPQQEPTTKKKNAALTKKISQADNNKPRQQTTTAQPKKVITASSNYYVQTGAFKEKILAQKLISRMKEHGWDAVIMPKSGFHAVWVGPKNSRSSIESLKTSINRTMKIKGFIVQK